MKCEILSLFDLKRDKISVKDLCEVCGISRTTWYNIVNSKKEPGVLLAIRITDYLNECLEKNGYTPDLYQVHQLWVE